MGGGFLFLIPQNSIAMLAGSDAPCVNHFAHEDAPVADFARMCCFCNYLDGRLQELVAADDGYCYTLDNVRRILHATVDAFLSALTDSVYVVILKPVDVRVEQCFLYILKLCLSDNCFNLFHTLIHLNKRPDCHIAMISVQRYYILQVLDKFYLHFVLCIMLFVDINQENTVKEPPVPIIIGYRRLIIGERVSSRTSHDIPTHGYAT